MRSHSHSIDMEIPGTFLIHFTFLGLDIATNTVAFATKISGEVANLRLVFTLALSKQKGFSSCHFAATFAEINKEMTVFSSGGSCRPFEGSPRRRDSSGPLAHAFTR